MKSYTSASSWVYLYGNMVQIVLSGGVLQMCFNREYIFAIKSVKRKTFFWFHFHNHCQNRKCFKHNKSSPKLILFNEKKNQQDFDDFWQPAHVINSEKATFFAKYPL